MKVKLTTPLGRHQAGDEIDLTTSGARRLIETGAAEPLATPKKPTRKKTASAEESTVDDTGADERVPDAEAGAPGGDSPSKAAKTAG